MCSDTRVFTRVPSRLTAVFYDLASVCSVLRCYLSRKMLKRMQRRDFSPCEESKRRKAIVEEQIDINLQALLKRIWYVSYITNGTVFIFCHLQFSTLYCAHVIVTITL